MKAAIKTIIGLAIASIPSLRVQLMLGAFVRRIWPGVSGA